MFGISFTEILIVICFTLLVFGPEKLPVIASKIGKIFGVARKTSDQFRREFYNSVYTPAKDLENKVKRELEAVQNTVKEEATEVAKQVSIEDSKEES